MSVIAAVTSAFMLTCAANAADIGFVKNTGNPMDPFDAGWIARLESQGHTVTVFNQADGLNPAVATMSLFIVSQDVGSGTAWSNFGTVTQPLLSYEYGMYDDMFGVTGQGVSSGLLTNGIAIVNSSSPLAAGLSGNVSIYTGDGGNGSIGRFDMTTVPAGVDVIAVSADAPAQGIFAELPAGVLNGSGVSFASVRMSLPCYDSWDPALVTADGWKLLDGAVAYALIPEPSSLALIGLGMAIFLARRQRR